MQKHIDMNDRRELFVDDSLIGRMTNTRLKLHEPVAGGTAIRIDKPWEGSGNIGLSVIRHNGRYHLYYRGWPNLKDDPNGVGCVAVSDDGATWTKPRLDLYRHPGWDGTNIIVSDAGKAELSFPFAPWIDTRPGVPDAERIKGITCEPLSGEPHTAMRDPGGDKRMVLWTSEDGFLFRRDDARSTFVSELDNAFDGGNTLFWSDAEQQYVLYYRCCDKVDGARRRTMARAASKDLVDWSESEFMSYGDSPREQFYVNNTQPYFRSPHIYIAPAARFMEGRRALNDDQAATLEPFGLGKAHACNDCSDGVLLTTRAGSTRYDRTFMETFIRPGPGAGNWVTRSNYPLTGILPCGPDQIMLFVSRHYMQNTWHVERLLLRTDGFVSVNAPWAGGEMVTKPLTFSGDALEINTRTSAPGFMRVELQDEGGAPIPGFSADDCMEIIGDEIERVVVWKQGSDVGGLAGRPIRMRFVMKDADLFALRFRGKSQAASGR